MHCELNKKVQRGRASLSTDPEGDESCGTTVNKSQAAATVVPRFFFLSLAYGSVQMKVEALIAGVWEGQTRLRAKGAEKALFAGRSTVMALVGKLADEMQSRWFTY